MAIEFSEERIAVVTNSLTSTQQERKELRALSEAALVEYRDGPRHVCGLQGFGRGLDDFCPACLAGPKVWEEVSKHNEKVKAAAEAFRRASTPKVVLGLLDALEERSESTGASRDE